MTATFFDDTESTLDNTMLEDAVIDGELYDADDQLLAHLGYRPELKREFSYVTVFGQSFGSMGVAPAIAESVIFSLGSAGTVGMVWTYLIGCLMLIPVSLSLGELGSSMPTSGGLYYVRKPLPISITLTLLISHPLISGIHTIKDQTEIY